MCRYLDEVKTKLAGFSSKTPCILDSVYIIAYILEPD